MTKEGYLAQIDAGGFKMPVLRDLSDATGNALDAAPPPAMQPPGAAGPGPGPEGGYPGAGPYGGGYGGSAGPSGVPPGHATYAAPPPDGFVAGRQGEWGAGPSRDQGAAVGRDGQYGPLGALYRMF